MPEKEPAPGEEPGAGDTHNDGNELTNKPVQLPWESEPHIHAGQARIRAIAAAQPPRTDTKSAVVVSYARKAFDDEIERVVHAALHTRNDTLFKAAANLFELVAAGALTEGEVVGALRDACMANHSIQDDGEPQFDRTVAQARRRGFDNPRDLSLVGTRAGDVFARDAEPKPLSLLGVQALERGFWAERESLQQVYLAALSRMCAPWAVLAHVVAVALALVRPHITLPPIIGGPGSLNWFATVAASSSGGKGGAASVAKELLPHTVPTLNLGSGEGVIDAYTKPADPKTGEPAGRHESVLFLAHEIDGLNALGQRNGSTLMPVLRSAFSGETLGFSNRNASRLHLEAHTYRMTLVLSAQPARCGGLLTDSDGGTPQRFMWFSGTDERITSQPPSMPGTLTLPEHSEWRYPTVLTVPYETVELIRDERVRAMRGEQDALDGHALFVREKFAFGLAVIDGRSEMSLDDWRLAGVAMRVSDHVRAFVTQQVELAAAGDAEKRGTERGIEHDAANDERDRRAHKRRRRIADLILKKLRAAGADGMTQYALSQTFAHRDRWLVEATLQTLEKNGEATRREPRDGDPTRTSQWMAITVTR